MLFEGRDIRFEKLSDQQFEELCFDLLLKLGFHSPVWRQGGSDSGRDIEAKYTVTNPLTGPYEEKWFVECKRYSKGVPVTEINSKIAWADAKRPQHFVVATSSYLTNSTRTWLDDITPQKEYKIHVLDGKR